MNATITAILIVEDDPEIGRLVAGLLEREGFSARVAPDGRAMDGLLKMTRPDLVILDLMLPGEDGLAICRRLQALKLPILMLSAKSDEIDRVVGLEMGADDYLTKPFSPRELVARVRAILRRVQAGPAETSGRRYGFGAFIIDLDARDLQHQEAGPVPLTSAEFDLLACFVTHPRRVLTRDQILDWTHGRSMEAYDRTVDMQISRLRKKLDAAGGAAAISTVRNGGYLFTPVVRPVA